MSEAVPLGAPVQVRTVERAYVETASIPWTVWCIIAGIVSGMIGGSWDISWHMSIGRDTFWTPAHILIQLTGVLAGIACAYMILTSTFASASPVRSASVQIWGFRGPLGAFMAVWGCVAMLTSTPFDNWWHNAYGLDVKIVSPPHVVLMLGSLAIRIGALALLVGLMNRVQEELRRKLAWLFFYVAATCVGQLALIILEPTWLVRMHAARCYLAVAIAIPAVLIGPAWGARRPWACTLVAVFYLGRAWWRVEASTYQRYIDVFKPPAAETTLENGNWLFIRAKRPDDQFVSSSYCPQQVSLEDVIPDHNHMMHLFLISVPAWIGCGIFILSGSKAVCLHSICR
jgi:hypothetical protein